MTRGRKALELPDIYEASEDGSKIRCALCKKHVSDYQWNYFLRRNLRSHEKSAIHVKALAAEANAEKLLTASGESVAVAEPCTFVAAHNVDSFLAEPLQDNPQSHRETSLEREMWEAYESGGAEFDVGKDPEVSYEQHKKKFDAQLDQYGLWDGLEQHPLGADMPIGVEYSWATDGDDDILNDILTNAASAAGDMLDNNVSENLVDASSWHPYPDKLHFLLDAIDHLPRLRISGSLMRVILWLLRESGVKEVPSFDGLRKFQKKLRDESSVPTIHSISPKGNAYSFNDPCALVANDWANPNVRPHICYYPIISKDGIVSEVWHGNKWRYELDRHLLSPMYDDGHHCHYYIDEVARTRGGELLIPIRWLQDEESVIWFEAWQITIDAGALSTIQDAKEPIINKASELKDNYLDLLDIDAVPNWSQETIRAGHPARMPNPDRAIAEGNPLYTSFVDIFCDDVSGNRSKSWNKHWNIYLTHRNLPRRLLQQQFHVHFVSTSNHASGGEQFHAVKNIINSTHAVPVKVRDGVTHESIRLRICVFCCPGDNPAQSEISGHIGGNGNFPCRKCHVGGSLEIKATESGFCQMFSAGCPRTARNTISEVNKQISEACTGVARRVEICQTSSGVKDSYTQHWIEMTINQSRTMRKSRPTAAINEIKDELNKWLGGQSNIMYNPFLELKGFDANRDTPIELLHTILLGIAKYAWYGTHKDWNDSQKSLYAKRLQSTDVSGLSIQPIRANYIMQYANSLIGKQFKTLIQSNIFHIHDLVNKNCLSLNQAVGDLAALLWFPEIRNMQEYLEDVGIAVANVLDIAALVDPTKILSKIKYHLLAHIQEDISRFGPLIGVATEVHESFNAVFRFCSILSNHQAPSRDIAYQQAKLEEMKHRLLGGWLHASKTDEWVQAGPAIRSFMKSNKFLAALYGWTNAEERQQGSVTLKPQKHMDGRIQPRASIQWGQTIASRALNADEYKMGILYECATAISQSRDECKVGHWVFAESSATDAPITGRIVEIMQDVNSSTSLVTIDVYHIAATRHDCFGMPVLRRRMGEKAFWVIKPKSILFHYNVQHDCYHGHCQASGVRQLKQEHVLSGKTENFVEHKTEYDAYIINLHALHNAHLLRGVLPRELVRPLPFAVDRISHHRNVIVTLQAKLAATLTKKKRKNIPENPQQAQSGPSAKRKRIEAEGDQQVEEGSNTMVTWNESGDEGLEYI